MDLTVLIEKIDDQRYRAATGQPIALETEGTTREEAVRRLEELARRRLSRAAIVRIELSEVRSPNPWVNFAGIWKDHPEYEQFRKNVREYRERADVDEQAT
jgi:hypothetical protein